MGIFQKGAKNAISKPDLPLYVDSLLDAADLSGVPESDPETLITHPVEYGIDKAIELLHKLPQENSALVVTVVRETLQSANIDVELVVSDAQTKTRRMQEKVAELSSEIAVLKTQIAQKEAEIVQTEAARKETQRVQDLLQQPQQPPQATKSAVVPLNSANR
ncbi:MAG: hypothetical protein LJE85_07685 [Gammaproteobacteria bacterium]|jgi:hypothetical protein|nr:hypothetical protein [Gammaproteobacteria bacterium]